MKLQKPLVCGEMQERHGWPSFELVGHSRSAAHCWCYTLATATETSPTGLSIPLAMLWMRWRAPYPYVGRRVLRIRARCVQPHPRSRKGRQHQKTWGSGHLTGLLTASLYYHMPCQSATAIVSLVGPTCLNALHAFHWSF